jgi:Protein of unknown function (DUF3800)
MTTRPLRQLVPPYLLIGKWIVVLVCYLDDSGKDPQNRITTLAGFAAKDTQWASFETEVELVFTEYGVNVLHARDLENTDAEFTGWTVLRKQAFVARIGQVMARHIPVGYSHSAVKDTYLAHARERKPQRTNTPYAFCFDRIVDWILRDIRVGGIANTEGVAFILECGHENNQDAQRSFYEVRKEHGLGDVLRSISFVGKESCRAIQIADLLAFYSRRHGAAMEAAPIHTRSEVKPSTMINIISEGVPIWAFVATDFGPHVSASEGDP